MPLVLTGMKPFSGIFGLWNWWSLPCGFPAKSASDVEFVSLSSYHYHDFGPDWWCFSCLFVILTHGGWALHVSVSKLGHQWSLVQIMICHLFSAKPLLEPMLDCCWLDTLGQIWAQLLSKCNNTHTRKSMKMWFAKWQPVCLSLSVLKAGKSFPTFYI